MCRKTLQRSFSGLGSLSLGQEVRGRGVGGVGGHSQKVHRDSEGMPNIYTSRSSVILRA